MAGNLKATIDSFNRATADLRNSIHDIENSSEKLVEQAAQLLCGAEAGTPDFTAIITKADQQATMMAAWSQEVATLARECMMLSHLAITQAAVKKGGKSE